MGIRKYCREFPSDYSETTAELYCFLTWADTDTGALGRYRHFKNVCTEIFQIVPGISGTTCGRGHSATRRIGCNRAINYSTAKVMWAVLPLGKPISGRQRPVIWWMADPTNSAVAVTSIHKKMVRQRSWSVIQRCYHALEDRKFGNFVDSQLEWQVKKGDSKHAIQAAGPLGISPFEPKTPRQVMEVKLGLRSVAETPAMRRGRELEARALSAFNELSGTECVPCVYTRGRTLASLDGFDSKQGVLVEIKCPMSDKMATEKEVPEHYLTQLAVQAYCCPAERIYLFFWWPDGRTNIFSFEPEGLIEHYVKKIAPVVENYLPHLLNRVLPPIGEGDTLHREDSAWVKVAREYILAKAELDAYQAKFDAAKAAVEEMSEGEENVDGGGIKVIRFERPGPVDYKAMFDAIPSDVRELVDEVRRKSVAVTKISIMEADDERW